MIHTHASENEKECQMVEQETGLRNITYLASLGLTGRHVALAHCVHLSDEEIEILRTSQTNVAHCPSSNLKLGSGIAPVVKLLEQGISVSLGADGAACNNRLDMFTEMRTAALLQKALHGPEVLPATRALRMATIDGARALGLDAEIGSIEVGKRADVAVVRLDGLHSTPVEDVVSAVVYSAQPDDVDTVVIDGEIVLRDGKLLRIDEREIIVTARSEAEKLKLAADLRG
jgi:5-methylthioadenosine/S-adenosylhomocysteine deaminase